jgi:branched-chain amino acid transport system permease protein
LLCCVLVCGLVGLVTGAVSLRTSGIGFIMITLAFAQMGYFVFVSLKQYGGDDGTTIAATSKFFGADLGQAGTVYWVALALLALVLCWTARLRVAPFGMVLRGARQNPRRINAIGLRSTRYQLAAYVLSAIVCGVAGMLLANLTAFASPSTLTWMVSGDLIVMIVLGGIGTVYGPLLGALAFLGLEEVLKMTTEYWMAVFGLAIVLIGVLGKAGIAGLLDSWGARRRNPKAEQPKTAVAVPVGEHP